MHSSSSRSWLRSGLERRDEACFEGTFLAVDQVVEARRGLLLLFIVRCCAAPLISLIIFGSHFPFLPLTMNLKGWFSRAAIALCCDCSELFLRDGECDLLADIFCFLLESIKSGSMMNDVVWGIEDGDENDDDWEVVDYSKNDDKPAATAEANPFLRLTEICLRRGLDPNYVRDDDQVPAISYLLEALQLTQQMSKRISNGESAHPGNSNVSGEDVTEMRETIVSLAHALVRNGARLTHHKLVLQDEAEILNMLGGEEQVETLRQEWTKDDKVDCFIEGVVKVSDKIKGGMKCDGGCEVCKARFRVIGRRKHLCNISKRWVCDDCSSKRVMIDGSEVRVSNGLYGVVKGHTAKFMKRKREMERERQERMLRAIEKEEKEAAARRRERAKGGSNSGGGSDDNSNRMELFGKQRQSIMNAVKGVGDFFSGEDSDVRTSRTSRTSRSAGSAAAAASEARDRLNERGEKLSQLSEKSEALANQSQEFARVAKALAEQERKSSNFFGF